MTEKIIIDLSVADNDNPGGRHWLWFTNPPKLQAIRKRHRDKHLAEQKRRRLAAQGVSDIAIVS